MSRSISIPGRDLDQFETFRDQPEHASLGHIENRLLVASRQGARKRDLIDLVDEFRRFSFAEDLELTIHDSGLEPAGGERPCEDQPTRILGYVDKSAGTGQAAVEQADIDIAAAIDLRHAEAGQIQSAAVVEIEHLVLVDDGLRH